MSLGKVVVALGGLWLLSRSNETSSPTPVTPLPEVDALTAEQLRVMAEHEAELAASRARGSIPPPASSPTPSTPSTPSTPPGPTPAEPSTPSTPSTPATLPSSWRSSLVDRRWTLAPALSSLADEIARSQDVPNRQGTPLRSDDLSQAQLPLAPGLAELARYVRSHTGLTVGSARGASVQAPARRADGSLRNRDVHEEGRAIDVMTSDVAQTLAIADWLLFNARVLGIQQIITQRAYWSSGRLRRNQAHSTGPYTGRSPHIDHVHAEMSPEWAFDVARVRSALASIAPLSIPGRSTR